jgi:uncharacterized protein YtpQ (UPF0354 family)
MGLFDKLFGKKEEKTKSILETPVEEYKKKQEGSVNIGQSIYPVFKRKDDPKINMLKGSQAVIKVDFLDDLYLCFNLDMGTHYEMVQNELLEKTNLTIDELKSASIRNLINKVNTNCKVGVEDFSQNISGAKPFYSVQFDNDLNASIFLIDDFWETNGKEITKSDRIAVSMPAKNLIYFSDMRLMESFRTMRPVGNHMYNASIEEGIQLTEKTYIRKDGKWILFLDTDEQLAELW